MIDRTVKIFNPDQGNIVIQMLTIMGGVSFLVASLITSQVNDLKESKMTSTKSQIEGLRAQFLVMLKSNQAWINTLKASNNPNLINCLNNTGSFSCGTNPWGAQTKRTSNWPIQLMDDENQPFLSNIYNPSSGFTITGKPCSSFNGSSGSDDCPFQVQTTWKRFCLSGSCTNGDLPGVEVYIDFIFKPKKYPLVALNSDLLSIQVVKSGLSGGESVLYNKTIRDTNNGYTINTVGNTWYGFINGVSMDSDRVCMTVRDISQSLNMSQRNGWVTVSASTEAQLPVLEPFTSDLIICIDSFCTSYKADSAAGEPIRISDSRSLPLAKRSYPYTIRVIHRPFHHVPVGETCISNMLDFPRTTKTFIDITVFRRD